MTSRHRRMLVDVAEELAAEHRDDVLGDLRGVIAERTSESRRE